MCSPSRKSFAVSGWRRDPYKILFPLGVLLGFWGTVPWLLTATGASTAYPSAFHATVMFQGFLTCFATGFLFTFVPRKTATFGPTLVEMAIAVIAPIAIAVLSWRMLFHASQVAWLLLMGMLLVFLLVRVIRADASHEAPAPFVFLLCGIGCALGGAALFFFGGDHGLGMALVTQGLFLSLVLAISQTVLPAFFYAKPPVKGRLFSAEGAVQAALAILLFASFIAEARGALRLGWGLRAAVCAVVLFGLGGLWRPPTNPGLHHRFTWLSLWTLPLGCALAAALPHHRVAALHVVFLGLGLMVFAFSAHVVLSHTGAGHLARGRPWPVAVFGVLALLAMGSRWLMSVDPSRFLLWLGAGAILFLGAGAVWFGWLVPRTLPGLRPRPS